VYGLNADGTIALGWGTDGVASGIPTSISNSNSTTNYFEDPASRTYITQGSTLSRLNIDGTFDTTIGNNGVVTLPTRTGKLFPLSDGSFLGQYGNDYQHPGLQLTHLGADFQLDQTFNAGSGHLDITSTWSPGKLAEIPSGGYHMITAEDGSPPAASPFSIPQAHGVWIRRIAADGSLDLSYGVGGVAKLDVSSGMDWFIPTGELVDSQGRLSLIAYIDQNNHDSGPDGVMYVARITAEGNPDSSFNSGFALQLDTAAYAQIEGIQPDGRIIVTLETGSPPTWSLVRMCGMDPTCVGSDPSGILNGTRYRDVLDGTFIGDTIDALAGNDYRRR